MCIRDRRNCGLTLRGPHTAAPDDFARQFFIVCAENPNPNDLAGLSLFYAHAHIAARVAHAKALIVDFLDKHLFFPADSRLKGFLFQHAPQCNQLDVYKRQELVCAPSRYLAQIDAAEDGEVRLRVTEKLRDTEAATRITLYQGLPKADKMEWIIQKSTELGAAAVAPVAMSRCVVKLEAVSYTHLS